MNQPLSPEPNMPEKAVTSPAPLKVGDKVSYQGPGRFCLRSWACRRHVKPGDIGVVVEQGTDTRPWCVKPGDESTWWRVDFGEGRVVEVNGYNVRIGQYKEASK